MGLKIGDQVVVNKSPNTYVYNVDNIDGFLVDLSYMLKGKVYKAGTMPASSLHKPSKTQLKNWEKNS